MTDDRLRLLFLCAHPALGPEARIALTLRCVAGLTTAAIARAFLVPEATMAQRLVRAKARIRATGIAFRMPGPEQLSARVETVLGVIYLIFNEGYLASSGDRVLQAELCDEAIRLGRLLREMVPGDVEVTGLLALMLLHHARTPARTSDGAMVPLDRQQRALWNRAAIDEGQALLASAFETRRPGPYQVQAAIAALHAQAATVETTDWPRIATLYGVLAALTPSPVVELNRAVAVAMAQGPAAGLVVLAPLLAARTLRDYAPLHAAHADLLRRSGDATGAAAAYRRAIAATANEAQRDELQRRLRDLEGEAPPGRRTPRVRA
jgi:RNA polymerase sigma-70 factor (ECF subfamily)